MHAHLGHDGGTVGAGGTMAAMLLAFSLLSSLLVAAAPPVQAANLGAKPGLWERSVTTRVSEARIQVPELSKIAPEERSKVDAAMREPVYAPDVTATAQECVTAQTAKRWTALSRVDADYAACTRKTISQSATRFKASLTCNGGKTAGRADFSVAGDRLSGEISLVTRESSYERTETKLVKGIWLGKECGPAKTASRATP